MQFLKNLFKRAKTAINPLSMNTIPNTINHANVRAALQSESLSEVIRVFEFFKRFDTQIASELNKRRMQVVRLPLVIESKEKRQDAFLKEFVKRQKFRSLLFECSSSIAYGFVSFLLEWESIQGSVYPKMSHLSPRYFNSDEYVKPYIEQGANRIYLHEKHEDIYTHFHPSDTGTIIESSLMYKIISLASLKYIAMQRYMNYLDSFAVPPLILKSEATTSKETSDLILRAALNLRSNGVGLFAKDDVLEVLHGNVDRGTFLEFMRYADECISKVITNQVLAGNSVQNGTQALGNIHEGIARNVLEFDAELLAEGMRPLLSQMLHYNFSNPAPFYFELDTNTEKDEKLQAEVYNLLSNMGIQIPLKHLENTFKIEGLEYRENQDNLLQSNTIKHVENNTIAKQDSLSHIDTLEHTLNPKALQIDDFLEDCSSYEEAFNKLENTLTGNDLALAKDELSNYIANAMIYGKWSAHDNL